MEKKQEQKTNQTQNNKPQGRGRSGERDRRRGRVKTSEFDKKVLQIRRVARVVAGGRRFSFAATVAIGDKKGSIGVGNGKGSNTQVAIEKAEHQAKKNMIKINLTKDKGIAHDVQAKYCSSYVALRPATGLIAGSAVRSIIELVGIRNIDAKLLSRSKSGINNARATIKALSELSAIK